MKTRPLFFSGIILFLCTASLCIPALLASPYRNIFIAVPKEGSSRKFSIQSLDEFSKDNFMISYEIRSPSRISLPHSEFSVTMIETTSSYGSIFSLPMLSGSFFSHQAWTGRLRHAVLNEKAAFEIFGSFNIAGSTFKTSLDTWLVTGVIKDGYKEQSRIYVPSSVQDGEAQALAMRVSGLYDENIMINSLKNINIRENDYTFVSFNSILDYLRDRVYVLLFVFAGLMFLSFLRPLSLALKKSWNYLQMERQRFYMSEIISNNKKLLVKTALPALCFAAFIALALLVFENIAAICLLWQNISAISFADIDHFRFQLENIFILNLVSQGLLYLSLVFTAVFFVNLNRRICQMLKNSCLELAV